MKKILALIFTLLLSHSFTLPARAFEPEIIELEDSLVCTDFDIDLNQETLVSVTPSPQVQAAGSQEQVVSGSLKVESQNFPDFSSMEPAFDRALKRLLPANSNPSFDRTPLKTKETHYVIGKLENNQTGPAQKTPQTQVSLPAWWTGIISQTRVLCSLFGNCPAPKSLNIQVAANNLQTPAEKIGCVESASVKEQSVAGLNTVSETFETKSIWQSITEIIQQIIQGILQAFSKTTTGTQLANRSRGFLAGGQTLANQADFLSSFLSADTIPANKSGPLASNTTYNYSVVNAGTKTEGKSLYYQDLARTRASYCLSQYSLLPEGMDLTGADKELCPSRDADDYPLTEGLNDIPLDLTGCNLDTGNACDYVDYSAGPSCTGDPICESGKCYPLMYRQAKDYFDHGCVVPYTQIAPDCFTSAVCRKMTFPKNPAGGFGSCRYQNATVCVRADRASIGSCAALCNWACCAY